MSASKAESTLVAGAQNVLKSDFSQVVQTLRDQVERNEYSGLAAYVCAIASAWAYAEEKPFLERMKSAGWQSSDNEHDAITAVNEALLLKTTAYWIRSGNVGILCFRGTEPMNPLAWFSNMAVDLDRFYTWGRVHRGFRDNLMGVMPKIDATLIAALLNAEPNSGRVEHFLICGHSLGAALATLTAAVLHVTPTPEYACIREKLRGVYCFGSPLVGDQEFCAQCEDRFGKILFRDIYRNDLITRLPPHGYGEFRSFGQEYVSTPEGWSHCTRPARAQARWLIPSLVGGLVGWYLKKLPGLHWIHLPPIGADNHLPSNYIECSRISLPV